MRTSITIHARTATEAAQELLAIASEVGIQPGTVKVTGTLPNGSGDWLVTYQADPIAIATIEREVS